MFCVAATTLVHGSTAATALADSAPPVPHPGRPRRAVGLRGADLRRVVLGSWVSVFPGTLEGLLGIKYDFTGTWGASRLTFEAFTLGTLPAIVVFCTLGYWWAQRHDDVGESRPPLLDRRSRNAPMVSWASGAGRV